jgi:hypothetical protein
MANSSPSVIKFLPTSIVMGGLGWAGIVWLIINTRPITPMQWLFFFLWFVALTGTALPIFAYLNLRFPGEPPATQAVIIRQATWIGIYGCVLAWLQIGRVVTFPLALWIAAGLGLIEWLLRLRERSVWKP